MESNKNRQAFLMVILNFNDLDHTYIFHLCLSNCELKIANSTENTILCGCEPSMNFAPTKSETDAKTVFWSGTDYFKANSDISFSLLVLGNNQL